MDGYGYAGLAAGFVMIVVALAILTRPMWRADPLARGAAAAGLVIGVIAVVIEVRQLV